MFSALFWNVLAPIAIVAVPLFVLASWIWAFVKIDQFAHSKLDPKIPAMTLEPDVGKALVRYLDERKDMGLPPPDESMDVLICRYKEALAHHH